MCYFVQYRFIDHLWWKNTSANCHSTATCNWNIDVEFNNWHLIYNNDAFCFTLEPSTHMLLTYVSSGTRRNQHFAKGYWSTLSASTWRSEFKSQLVDFPEVSFWSYFQIIHKKMGQTGRFFLTSYMFSIEYNTAETNQHIHTETVEIHFAIW